MAKTKTSKKAAHSLPPEFEKILKEIAARKASEDQIGRDQLNVVCPELFLLGCTACYASYSGEGDSGCIAHIYCTDVNDKRVDVPQKLLDALENAIYHLLPSGFEINDGSYGEVTIDIQNKKIKLEHNERVIEVNSSEQNFTY